MFNRLIDRVTKKKWTEAELDAMVGPAIGCYLSHSPDPEMRAAAASGGTTSALMVHALQAGLIDGAIVCRTFIEDGKVRAHFVMARTVDEILAARGSKYVETKFLREVLPLLEQNEGRFAVCGLPCDITNLKRWEQKNPQLAGKVALRIAFLCGHNSRKELIDGVTAKLCRQADCAKLVDYKFRTGHWRGELSAHFDNGKVIKKPFGYFSDYRNLYFFAERKCVACIDHFGFDADIAFGDVWLYALKDDPVKKTCAVVRSERGMEMFRHAIDAGAFVAEEVGREMILDGQTRIAPTHYNVAARSRAGRWLGVKIPDGPMKVGPVKFFSALVGLANMRWSESNRADLIFKMPKPILRGYLVFKKGIESIK